MYFFQLSYRFTHTVKIQTSFCVATNLTCRIREQSAKTRLVNLLRSMGMSVCLSLIHLYMNLSLKHLPRRQWLLCLSKFRQENVELN